MSGWKDGYEEYPWCPTTRKPCPQDGKPLCPVCREVVRAMDLMEGAIVAEKERHNKTELQVGDLQKKLEISEAKVAYLHECSDEQEKKYDEALARAQRWEMEWQTTNRLLREARSIVWLALHDLKVAQECGDNNPRIASAIRGLSEIKENEPEKRIAPVQNCNHVPEQNVVTGETYCERCGTTL